ncbi:MAG: BlaI/MecI/CopY family transcriptional regulator [Planctomycetes bacterium]|nr:BlaI/MecI/CopY family transcriptional regulator [Planctomycetota bacterium]
MTRKKQSGPTEREIEILKILWQGGPSTVRQVNEVMNARQETGYTTTLKLMQIMVDKGLLSRDDSQFKHLFTAAVSEESTQKQLVGNLLERVFSGSTEKLVMRALSAKKISKRDLGKIRELIERMEEKQK